MMLSEKNEILVLFDEFLSPFDLGFVRAEALKMESRFSPSTTVQMGRPTSLNLARRRSNVVIDVDTGHVGKFFKSQVEQALPSALEELHLPVRKAQRISLQITSTGDGGFYKPHTDNSPHDRNRRLLSFVFFCNQRCGSFQGGELRIYDTQSHDSMWDSEVKVHVIAPEQNRIIFFRSDYVHEISPVICPSNELKDTRLTLNGWIYFAMG
jgi:SM-20-related protein